MSFFRPRWILFLLLLTGAAHAQGISPGAGLLPLTQGFVVQATIDKPGTIALHFAVAPHYYLYRGRIHATILTPGIAAGALDLPPGKSEHDPYLGEVEIYQGTVDGSLPYQIAGAAPAALQVSVSYQGCHEITPKICYPPNTQVFTLPASGGGPVAVTGA